MLGLHEKGMDRMAVDSPLVVEDVVKKYTRKLHSFHALENVSFSMKSGEILGFLGPNGAGKTTMIKCILGLLFPTQGKILLWDLPPAHHKVRKLIGYVPESPDYEDAFSPMEFLQGFAHMRGFHQTDDEMIELLGRVGLTGWENVRIRQFSKGMRQKLSLAIALQFKPELLIMDEPTGGLDPVARKRFRDIILEENGRGATIFLSSHLLSEVETVCHRAIILSRGKVVREGSMDELLLTENEYRILYRTAPGEDSTCSEEEITVHEKRLQSEIGSLQARGCEIIRVGQIYRSLEDVFLSATGETGQ
jgi:ABC-2 type transport system ATP-binding protein